MALLYRSAGGLLTGKYGVTKGNFKTTCVMYCPLAAHHAAQCLPPGSTLNLMHKLRTSPE